MSRQTATVTFQALELKGSLLPASLLEEVSKFNRPKELLLEPHDYGLSKGERLRDRIDAAWVLTKELWDEYSKLKERAGQSIAGQHFGHRLLKEVLGWSGVEPCSGWQQGESHYPITHRAFGGSVPLILRGIDAGALDRGSAQFGHDGRKRSPHSCLQECLNADDSANWGVLLSGDRLRLLHDNPSLVKPAYLTADLELMIEGERFDEFSVLWLLLHASRFEHPKSGSCVLDDWKQKAEVSGERVLGALRSGVQSALESLGSGFLNHPANGALRDALFKNHTLSKQQFHEQLLRLVYRFLFLFTAEDRDLLFPREVDKGDPRRRIYREGYSVSRLRELAIKRSAYEGDYSDLWELQRLVFQQLSIGNSPLGLPGLGGLFSLEQCTDLQAAELRNGPLLRAIKAIGWFDAGGSFTRVRYRDLNTEELGSVYEGLLELHPQPEPKGLSWEWRYSGGAGSDRKTTGSYYTPDALVQELIKSALIPVIDDRISQAHGQAEQEQALLTIKVIDPACGSGHFLLAAARRLAVALAQVRAGDDQPSEDDRQHALRDVVAHCIYAVDRNPMAVELCKVALWIEAIDPGKPLSFLDAHIQCGDSLVGVFDPKVLEEGIPDEAYKQLTGDNKTVCTSLKNENKAARKTISRGGSNRGIQGSLDLSGTQPRSQGQQALQAIEAMPEATLAETAAKQAAYAQWLVDRGRDPETLAADLYTAAFFLAKTSDSRATVPTTEHLLKLLAGQPIEEVMEEAVVQAAQNFRFFHWHLRFGEVMAKGGFDCVLGNPPWETLSPDEKEWFAQVSPQIRSLSATERKGEMERILLNPSIEIEWSAYCKTLYQTGEYLKGSGRFTLFADGNLGKGDLNVYRMFVELALALHSGKGYAGQIAPDNLYNGANATAIRKEIFAHRRLVKLITFINTSQVWFDVATNQRFCMYVVTNGTSEEFSAKFGVSRVADLGDNRPFIMVSIAQVRESSPETLAIQEIADSKSQNIFSRLSSFVLTPDNNVLWGTEVHMDRDKRLFQGPGPSLLSLAEGRMIDLYDFKAKSYLDGHGRSAKWQDIPIEGKNSCVARSQWYVNPAELPQDRHNNSAQYRAVFARVVSPSAPRTLTACIVPPGYVLGDAVPWVKPNGRFSPDLSSLLWVAIANSIVCDFIAKSKVSLNITFATLASLPLPWDGFDPDNEIHCQIIKQAIPLIRINSELDEWTRRIGSHHCIGLDCCNKEVSSAKEFLGGLASLDVLIARHYFKLKKIDMEHILGLNSDPGAHVFKRLEKKEIAAYGEFASRRLILEAWDGLFAD